MAVPQWANVLEAMYLPHIKHCECTPGLHAEMKERSTGPGVYGSNADETSGVLDLAGRIVSMCDRSNVSAMIAVEAFVVNASAASLRVTSRMHVVRTRDLSAVRTGDVAGPLSVAASIAVSNGVTDELIKDALSDYIPDPVIKAAFRSRTEKRKAWAEMYDGNLCENIDIHDSCPI